MSRSIVVLESRRDPTPSAIARAIAGALTTSEGPDPAVGGSRGDHAVIHGAHAAVCLDGASLDRAREAGVPFCVAVLPGFSISWDGPLGEADRVFVAHEAIAAELSARGVPSKLVEVVGPIVPDATSDAPDRVAARASAKLEDAAKLVLVPAAVIEEEGVEAVLLQLGLVAGEVGFLFDVDKDAALASLLRDKAQVHAIEAWMFADEPGSDRFWRAADVALALATGDEIAYALASGVPVIAMPSAARSGDVARRALAVAGLATNADSLATLSVAIDRALEPSGLEARRAAIAALDVAASPKRLAAALEKARADHEAAIHAPRGLPHGLERISSRTGEKPRPVDDKPDEPRTKDTDDFEARVERELQELKKRLK
jgi:hypothetical protein